MSQPIWSFDDLVRLARAEQAEVRYWAVERLIRRFPDECCDAVAELLLDEHQATPALVARHLSEHGNAKHHPILIRGFRLLRGHTPGLCLQALVRLGYPRVVDLAADGLKRGDLANSALATIVESLADLGSPAARELARETLTRNVELLAEPSALRGALAMVAVDEIAELLESYLRALQQHGTERAGEAFRALMDALRIDDAAWCFRTGPSGHLELRKTIKAVESGYDCDISAALGEATIKQLAQRFRAGDLIEVVRALAEWTAQATHRLPAEGEHGLARRIEATVRAFAQPAMLEEMRGLGQQFQQWILGFHLSAAFAVARGREVEVELSRARGNLDRLLELAELETAHLLGELPASIAVVCAGDEARARRAQEWCLRMLEAQGPFFPKVVALETLGELRAVHFVPEVIDYLSDENSYVYGAAERALGKMGEASIIPAVNRLAEGDLDPDAAHSILVLLCDLGTEAAYEAVERYLDYFVDAVGPGTTAEWVSLFGAEELIEPLRDWLDEDPVLVGQALLLLGAIHNVQIPEEAEILRAIEDERARQDEGSADEPEPSGGEYLM